MTAIILTARFKSSSITKIQQDIQSYELSRVTGILQGSHAGMAENFIKLMFPLRTYHVRNVLFSGQGFILIGLNTFFSEYHKQFCICIMAVFVMETR